MIPQSTTKNSKKEIELTQEIDTLITSSTDVTQNNGFSLKSFSTFKKNDEVFLSSLTTSFTPPPQWPTDPSPESILVQRFQFSRMQKLPFCVKAEVVNEKGKTFKTKGIKGGRYIKFKFNEPILSTEKEIVETAKHYFLEISKTFKSEFARKKRKLPRAEKLNPGSIQLKSYITAQNYLTVLIIKFEPTDDWLASKKKSPEANLVLKINNKKSKMHNEIYAQTCRENVYVGDQIPTVKYVKFSLITPLCLGHGDKNSLDIIVNNYFSALCNTICNGTPLPDRNTYCQQNNSEPRPNQLSITTAPMSLELNHTTNDFAANSFAYDQSLNLTHEPVIDTFDQLAQEDYDYLTSIVEEIGVFLQPQLPSMTPQFSQSPLALINKFNNVIETTPEDEQHVSKKRKGAGNLDPEQSLTDTSYQQINSEQNISQSMDTTPVSPPLSDTTNNYVVSRPFLADEQSLNLNTTGAVPDPSAFNDLLTQEDLDILMSVLEENDNLQYQPQLPSIIPQISQARDSIFNQNNKRVGDPKNMPDPKYYKPSNNTYTFS